MLLSFINLAPVFLESFWNAPSFRYKSKIPRRAQRLHRNLRDAQAAGPACACIRAVLELQFPPRSKGRLPGAASTLPRELLPPPPPRSRGCCREMRRLLLRARRSPCRRPALPLNLLFWGWEGDAARWPSGNGRSFVAERSVRGLPSFAAVRLAVRQLGRAARRGSARP